ncbi:hypothetical protein RFI_05755 [Reticulomyxa filosa]|uniref:Uncharacterized protein n=1 Tax=Reticulomyxa filosa TaxID=46433 RepID=X6NYJ1_RETFI|nr:hypothetical protein RFI_05755 [Reticulomyxa filosa]|eukprot:ETO31365.1 hypothetical protein RFI_05755 [Reticulomyxa filosa]
MLKIGWLQIGSQTIAYWNDLLFSPTKPCNVQLCAVPESNTIHDLTSNNSIFSVTTPSHFAHFRQTIAEKPGVCYKDFEQLLKYPRNVDIVPLMADFENPEDEQFRYSNNNNWHNPKKIDIMLFFQKVVEIMEIDNTKVEEYKKWFDIDEADWILDLFSQQNREI